jgi:hypothetical protein
MCGVKNLATERTLSRRLKRFTPKTITILNQLNSFLVLQTLAMLELARVTLNFDGTVDLPPVSVRGKLEKLCV